MPYTWRYYAAQQTEWGQFDSVVVAEAALAREEAAKAAVTAAEDAALEAVAASVLDAALGAEREAQHRLEVLEAVNACVSWGRTLVGSTLAQVHAARVSA